jgi:hypothetical protein
MPKLFCISDVHGFYDEMIEALDEAGFDPDNEEHWLVSLGDHFDRGPNPGDVMHYLCTLPRKILVKGNHETLLEECCARGYPLGHDYSNGTMNTICELGNMGVGYSFEECCDRTLAKVHLFFGSMVDYFETKNYIFVHSWIPVNNEDGLPAYYTRYRKFSYNPEWRNASKKRFEDAKWGNPFDMAASGLKPEKTVVFGHWATEHKWAEDEGREEFDENARFEPYFGDDIIGLDCTTALSHKVGVVVLEDEFMDE